MVESLRGSKLVSDYLDDAGTARRFFRGAPDDPGAYVEKADEVDGRFTRQRREEVAGWLSVPEDDGERLERWVAEGGYFVTTGQQPGLFGGPLYTVYKALSAVARARAVEEVLGRPVLPVFWIASEDHDWEESAGTWLVDVENELREVRVAAPEGDARPPVHRVPLAEAARRALDEVESLLPATDFSASHLDLLRRSYTSESTLADGFRTVMEELLGPYGVCFLEAHRPELKKASLPLLFRELDEAEASEALLDRRSRELTDAGYEVQVPILEGGVNVFLEGPGGRERLFRGDDGDLRLRRSETRWSRDEIVRCAEGDPSAISPNVLLRPIVEATLLPTICYVSGPGETAYFAQLSEYFASRDVRMPVVAPRSSLTLVEAKNRKVLEKFGLRVRELDRPFHELASEIARDEVPSEVQKILGRLRRAVEEEGGALLDEVRSIDPTLRGPVTGARSTFFQTIAEVEKKIVQAVKRQDEIAMQQLEKAQVHLFPRGEPQERVLNVFYFLVRYGERFLPAVADGCAVDLDGAGT